jgi:two-component system, OmpR family, alkaline phosphatase synthesis response regulator PhoP
MSEVDRLCLVEDDPTIRELVAKKLTTKGYSVETFDSAEPVLKKIESRQLADLYILDVLLDGAPRGLELCQKLRDLSPVIPILILSALSEPADRIEGLKHGADDYLAKPFEMEELLLRVDGMLKRRSWYGTFPKNESIYTWEANRVDFASLEGRRGFDSFLMSQKECMLMKLLIEKENQVVSRDEILNKVWGYDAFPSTRTVDNFILRLRKYFETEPKQPKYIHSVRGLGYKFTSKAKE